MRSESTKAFGQPKLTNPTLGLLRFTAFNGMIDLGGDERILLQPAGRCRIGAVARSGRWGLRRGRRLGPRFSAGGPGGAVCPGGGGGPAGAPAPGISFCARGRGGPPRGALPPPRRGGARLRGD